MTCCCLRRSPPLFRSLSTKSAPNPFAEPSSAQFLASASTSDSIPRLHGLPEVIVTGRANVGKSTLLNAVLGRKNLLRTSKKPGRTQTLNFYQVGAARHGLIVVDAPGYGGRGRPEWGELFKFYTEHRKQLKRIFILFNASHGLTETDIMMLQNLDEQYRASAGLRFTLQAIITKADTIPDNEIGTRIPKMKQNIVQAAPTCLAPIITSAHLHPFFGIDEVRRAIIRACLT